MALCGGKLRDGSGGTCHQTAGWGTPHPGTGACKLHGGSMKNHLKHAEDVQARAAVVTYGLPIDVSPTEAILEEIKWTAGHVAWLRQVVQSILPNELTWGMTRRDSAPAEDLDKALAALPAVTESAGVSVWVKLYQEERKHLVEVAATALRIGIEERRVRLAEDQGKLLVVGLQWLIRKLELEESKAELANTLVVEMLRHLDSGKLPELEE